MEKDVDDLDKIERDCTTLVEEDDKYFRENDAKFRAVHQRVQTYDEFRNIVLASNLKPLEKKDTFETIKSFKTQWNVCASNRSVSGSSSSDVTFSTSQPNSVQAPADQRNANTLPKTLSELQSRIASLETPDARFSLLSAFSHESGVLECVAEPNALRACIERSSLAQMLSADLPTRLLLDVVDCLRAALSSQTLISETDSEHSANTSVSIEIESHKRCAIGVLLLLSGGKRFRLALQFLNAQQKKNLKELFDLLSIGSSTTSTFLFDEARQVYSSVLSK